MMRFVKIFSCTKTTRRSWQISYAELNRMSTKSCRRIDRVMHLMVYVFTLLQWHFFLRLRNIVLVFGSGKINKIGNSPTELVGFSYLFNWPIFMEIASAQSPKGLQRRMFSDC